MSPSNYDVKEKNTLVSGTNKTELTHIISQKKQQNKEEPHHHKHGKM